MTIHEFGKKENPVILLLPGTMCHWKGNFDGVIDKLAEDFLVSCVAYTGFDEGDKEDYRSVMDEVQRIEEEVQRRYGGAICAAYGCSLGGTFVAHLIHRHKIHMKAGIIGSSDLDQAGSFKANLMASLMVRLTWNFIHTGHYKSKLMKKHYEKQMADPDPYNRAFVEITGIGRYDMSYISKESIYNQFRSDLVTPLPKQIDNGETEVHVFYAKKMGEKYLDRYKKYFKNPVIHERDLRHEELLGVYPVEWCGLVKKICLRKEIQAMHGVLIRTHTVAAGDDYCDWWYFGDRQELPEEAARRLKEKK